MAKKKKLIKKTKIIIKVILVEVVLLAVGGYFLIQLHQKSLNNAAQWGFKQGMYIGHKIGTNNTCKDV